MSNKYKIKIGETKVPEKVIEKHKNFSEVMTSYQQITRPWYKIPLYKNPKAFLGLVMIVALAFLVYEAVTEEEKMDETGGHASAQVFPHKAGNLPQYETLLADSISETLTAEWVEPTEVAMLGQIPGVPAKPVAPRLADSSLYHFDLAFDPADYPELADYGTFVWEYSGTDSDTDPAENSWALEREWESLELVRNLDDSYTLTFSNSAEKFSTLAAPAFSETDYPSAETAYKSQLKEFYAAWSRYLNQGL